MTDFTKYTEWIAQHLAGEISKEDRKRLMEWVDANAENQAFFDQTVELWKVSESYDEPFEANVENAWNQLESRLEKIENKKDSSAKIIRLSNFKQLWKVAAVFLIAATGLYFMFQNSGTPDVQFVEYQTADKEKKEITLPDNSIVWLNQNSRLTYQKDFGKRLVTLEGEAWFDVQHLEKQTFEIESGEARTVVLGTAFNVRAYPAEDRIEVTVERGKVAFSEKDNSENSEILLKDMVAVFHKKEKEMVKDTIKVNNATAWRTEKLVFDNTPMEEVIASLERYYEVEIEIDPAHLEILNCTSNSTFSNRPLEYVMGVISNTLNFTYEHQGDVWILSGEGCAPKVIE